MERFPKSNYHFNQLLIKYYRCYKFSKQKYALIIFVDMEVNKEMIERLANLARLEFTEEEKEGLQIDLKKMIEFVDQLNEVDTENVEPLLHMSIDENVLREDEIKGQITHEEALQNAIQKDEHFFKVPKVIKN